MIICGRQAYRANLKPGQPGCPDSADASVEGCDEDSDDRRPNGGRRPSGRRGAATSGQPESSESDGNARDGAQQHAQTLRLVQAIEPAAARGQSTVMS
jgi:hypothetical protein